MYAGHSQVNLNIDIEIYVTDGMGHRLRWIRT